MYVCMYICVYIYIYIHIHITITITIVICILSSLTSGGNIDITTNQISLTFPSKINGEIVMNPRAYVVYFEMYAGTSGFVFFTKHQ